MNRSLLLGLTAIAFMRVQAQTSDFQSLTYIEHATCGSTTGSIYVSVWGGVAPYAFLWSPTPPNGQGTSSITDVPAGVYTLTIMDSNAEELVQDIEIIQTPDLFPAIGATEAWSCEAGCNGTWYQYVPIGGGAAVTTTFDPPGPVGNANPNGIYLSSLCIGENYTVTVSDDNGCVGTVGPLTVIGPMNPQLLTTDVTPSCPNGSTGSFTVLFDNIDSLTVSGPSGTWMSSSANPFTAENLAPGTYTLYASVGGVTTPPGTTGGCSVSYQVEVPVSTDPCGEVNGIVYADLDADCSQGGNDPGMPYRVLEIGPGGNYTLTNADGTYATELFYGSYDLDATIADYDVICPALPTPFMLDAGMPTTTIDLACEPTMGPDLRATLSAGTHRPNFAVNYTAVVQNDGPYAFTDLVVDLYYDPVLTFLSVDGPGTLVAAGHIQWMIPTLGAFQTITYVAHLSVPNIPALLGTTMVGTITVTPVPADSDPSNDTYSIANTVVNSVDPNDKLARTSTQLSEAYYFLDADTHIDYTVRFQNIGTVEAIDVVVTDTISNLFQIPSLEILGASHAFTAQLLPGRVLEFTFAEIMLPDSATDQAGSQGFVSFRLKPVDGLVTQTVIPNAADIYFDANDAIRTNTATLITEMTVGTNELARTIGLHPNPVRDQLIVDLPLGIASVEILAMDGRVLHRVVARTSSLRFDVANLPAGGYLLRAIAEDGTLYNAHFMKH